MALSLHLDNLFYSQGREEEGEETAEDGTDRGGGDGREDRDGGAEASDRPEKAGVHTNLGRVVGASQGDVPEPSNLTFQFVVRTC